MGHTILERVTPLLCRLTLVATFCLRSLHPKNFAKVDKCQISVIFHIKMQALMDIN